MERKLWTANEPKKLLSRNNLKNTTHTLKQLIFPKHPQKSPQVLFKKLEFNTVLNLNPFPGLFVVGILGRDNVGKTTILNKFNPLGKSNSEFQLTCDGIVLLNLQALSDFDVDDIKRTIFTLAVCNLVLLVTDNEDDVDLFQFIDRIARFSKIVDRRQQMVQKLERQVPNLVVVLNKVDGLDCSTKKAALEKNIEKVFKSKEYVIKGNITQDYIQSKSNPKSQTEAKVEPKLNCFIIPKIIENETLPSSPLDLYSIFTVPCRSSVALQDLIHKIKALPRLSTQGQKAVYSYSERDWHKFAAGIWERIMSVRDIDVSFRSYGK